MWLLAENVAREMRASARGISIAEARAKFNATAQAVDAARDEGKPRNLFLAGDTAEISIAGLLTQKRDFWAWLLGYDNTTYGDIQASIALAERDPAVRKIVFNVNSPGGQVDGLFDTIAAMESITKPKSTVASYACSAGFALATAGGRITVPNAAVTLGSVGVVATYFVDDELVEITSTEAPDKRPDPATDEGKATIRKYLDAVHQLFVEVIARGRGTDVETVNATYGRGAVLLAGEAKKRGMIDAISAKPPKATKPTSASEDQSANGGEREPEKMDLKTLKAQHPDVYAQAVSEGSEQGVAKERDRVGAHIKMGDSSGDIKTAHKAILEGTEMTQTLMATYMAAGMNRNAQQARQDDDDAAGAAVAGAGNPDGAEGANDDGSLPWVMVEGGKAKKHNA